MALKPAALWRCIGAARALGAARRADGEARRHVQPAAAPNGRCLRAVPRRLPRPERPGEAGAAPPQRRAPLRSLRASVRGTSRALATSPTYAARRHRRRRAPPPCAAASCSPGCRRRRPRCPTNELLTRRAPRAARADPLPRSRAAAPPHRVARPSTSRPRRCASAASCGPSAASAPAAPPAAGASRVATVAICTSVGRGGGGQRRPRATPTARTTRPLAPPALAAPAPAPVGRAPSPSPTHGAVLRRPRGPAAVGRGGCPRRRSRGRAGAARPRPRAARGTPGARARSGQAPPGARASAARPQATRGGRPAARGAGAPRNPAQPPHRRQARRGEGEPRLHRRLAHRHRSQPPPHGHRGGRLGFERASRHLAGFGGNVSSSAPAG